MRICGLTGGIACGKSAVSRLLREEHGLRVIDADRIAHGVLRRGTRCYDAVCAEFGPAILEESREIDRAKLGDIVFNDAGRRAKLNKLTRPHIARGIFRELAIHFLLGTLVVVLDVPLLFETKLHMLCSLVVVVSVDQETQLRRLVARDGRGEADARARITAQPLTLAEKASRADILLDNSASVEELGASLRAVMPRITRLSLGNLLFSAPAALVVGVAAHAFFRKALPTTGLAVTLFVAAALRFGASMEVATAAARLSLTVTALCYVVGYRLVGALALSLGAWQVLLPLRKSRLSVVRYDDSEVEPLERGCGVVFAASFNPIHSGHVALLRAMARRHPGSTIYACVAYNPKKHYAVSADQRRDLIQRCCDDDPVLTGSVKALVVSDYPWRFAMAHDAKILYRGLRSWHKDGTAETVLQLLNIVGPFLLARRRPVPTRFIHSPPELADVSSSLVRNNIKKGQSIKNLVPDAILPTVSNLYKGKEA